MFHSVIGLAEAAITGVAIGYILRTRPDLIHSTRSQSAGSLLSPHGLLAGLSFALALACFLSPLASELPDGLESALSQSSNEADHQRAGLDTMFWEGEAIGWVPLPDYQFRGWEDFWIAGSLAGAIGTLATFLMAYWMGRNYRRSRPESHVG